MLDHDGYALNRRAFLKASAAGLGGVALASFLGACGPRSGAPAPSSGPATEFTGGGSLKILTRSHFVPAYDTWFDQWAADWGAKNNVEVTIEIQATVPDGYPEKTVRTISENCRTLKFTQQGFEVE